MFSEDITRHWAANSANPRYELVAGRPTLWSREGPGLATIDFALRLRDTNAVYVAEQKAEIAFEDYRYLVLESGDLDQIEHHAKGRTFAWFLDVARDPTSHPVTIAGKKAEVAGAILVWGAVEPSGREAARAKYGFADVLSLEDMLADLRAWEDLGWTRHVDELRGWANDLFGAVGMPERVRLRRLGAWTDRFADPEFTFGSWVEPVETSPGHWNFGYYAMSDEALLFYEEMYALGWVRPFDWKAWTNTAAGSRLPSDRSAIAEADAEDLWKVMTTIVRAARFSEGGLGSAYESGILLALAQRARALTGDEG